MSYAAVDIGTNSCRLLIAEPDAASKLVNLYKGMETTRIGEGVNRTGFINADAMERTLLCMGRFREKMQSSGVEKYRAIATSAVREAGNGAEFARRAGEEQGMDVDIVSGEEEAVLSYQGVIGGLSFSAPPLVADLGGGSTEFICPEENLLLSVPLGAVRATEAGAYAAQIAKVLAPIGRLKQSLSPRPLVLVGGTATTLVAVKMGMETYDPDLAHGQVLTRSEIGDLYNLFERMPLHLRRRLPGLQPERADIISKGALIVLIILEILGKDKIIVSENDLLEGIIHSLINE